MSFDIKIGETLIYTIVAKNKQLGTTVDLTGYTGIITIKEKLSDKDEDAIHQEKVVGDASTMIIIIKASDTASFLEDGKNELDVYWDLKIIAPDTTTKITETKRAKIKRAVTIGV